MLRFLYQLDHDFRTTAADAVRTKGEGTVELAVHQFGAFINRHIVLELSKESKLYLAATMLARYKFSGARGVAFLESAFDGDHPIHQFRWFLLRAVRWIDRISYTSCSYLRRTKRILKVVCGSAFQTYCLRQCRDTSQTLWGCRRARMPSRPRRHRMWLAVFFLVGWRCHWSNLPAAAWMHWLQMEHCCWFESEHRKQWTLGNNVDCPILRFSGLPCSSSTC